MTERIKAIQRRRKERIAREREEAEAVRPIMTVLHAVTEKVLSHRPVDKGLAAKKAARKLKRQARKETQSDRESS